MHGLLQCRYSTKFAVKNRKKSLAKIAEKETLCILPDLHILNTV